MKHSPTPRGGAPVALPSLTVLSFEPYNLNALRGFVTVALACGIVIHDVAVLSQYPRRWTSLPNRPRLQKGKATRSKSGGYVADQVIDIPDRQVKAAFDRAVISALESYLERGLV